METSKRNVEKNINQRSQREKERERESLVPMNCRKSHGGWCSNATKALPPPPPLVFGAFPFLHPDAD